MDIEAFNNRAKNLAKENKEFYRKLKNKAPQNLDGVFHELHEKTFTEIDCLTCANCCKTTSPIFYQRDIERAAKALKLKPGIFAEKFLKVDEEHDYVLKTAPCPFLNGDNSCSIYDDRPNACREYPHTNRKKMQQILELTFRNTLVCPAVLKITEELKKLKLTG